MYNGGGQWVCNCGWLHNQEVRDVTEIVKKKKDKRITVLVWAKKMFTLVCDGDDDDMNGNLFVKFIITTTWFCCNINTIVR